MKRLILAAVFVACFIVATPIYAQDAAGESVVRRSLNNGQYDAQPNDQHKLASQGQYGTDSDNSTQTRILPGVAHVSERAAREAAEDPVADDATAAYLAAREAARDAGAEGEVADKAATQAVESLSERGRLSGDNIPPVDETQETSSDHAKPEQTIHRDGEKAQTTDGTDGSAVNKAAPSTGSNPGGTVDSTEPTENGKSVGNSGEPLRTAQDTSSGSNNLSKTAVSGRGKGFVALVLGSVACLTVAGILVFRTLR